MIHTESWYRESEDKIERLRKNKLMAIQEWVQELSRAGRLKDLPQNQIIGLLSLGVNFRGLDLSEAYLNSADLSGADLMWVDLRGADLRDADFRGADLRGADLRGANLQWSNLEGAKLRGAIYYPPQLKNTSGTPIL